jgi:hypothetical protein
MKSHKNQIKFIGFFGIAPYYQLYNTKILSNTKIAFWLIGRLILYSWVLFLTTSCNVKSDVIDRFVPETPPGSLITINLNPPIY